MPQEEKPKVIKVEMSSGRILEIIKPEGGRAAFRSHVKNARNNHNLLEVNIPAGGREKRIDINPDEITVIF